MEGQRESGTGMSVRRGRLGNGNDWECMGVI